MIHRIRATHQTIGNLRLLFDVAFSAEYNCHKEEEGTPRLARFYRIIEGDLNKTPSRIDFFEMYAPSPGDNTVPLPYPMAAHACADMAWGWLQNGVVVYPEKPNADGSLYRGYLVGNDLWDDGRTSDPGIMVSVQPEWILYHK